MTLEQIAIKHKTQKVPHGYMPIYERHFESMRDKKITLIEIGVAGGASIRTWADYFSKGKIIGLEKHEGNVVNFDYDGQGHVLVIECDVSSEQEIDRVGIKERFPQVDIIIDDGSHWAHEQLNAFKFLWDNLKPGGLVCNRRFVHSI